MSHYDQSAPIKPGEFDGFGDCGSQHSNPIEFDGIKTVRVDEHLKKMGVVWK